MKWKKDKFTDNYLCPKCGAMVQGDGYGGIQYEFCPYCGRAVEPVKAEDKGSEENAE